METSIDKSLAVEIEKLHPELQLMEFRRVTRMKYRGSTYNALVWEFNTADVGPSMTEHVINKLYDYVDDRDSAINIVCGSIRGVEALRRHKYLGVCRPDGTLIRKLQGKKPWIVEIAIVPDISKTLKMLVLSSIV